MFIQNQYVAVFLALQEAFQAQPALQSKKQFLNKVTSLMKNRNMISTSLKQEHEVWFLSIVYLNFWKKKSKKRSKAQIYSHCVYVSYLVCVTRVFPLYHNWAQYYFLNCSFVRQHSSLIIVSFPKYTRTFKHVHDTSFDYKIIHSSGINEAVPCMASKIAVLHVAVEPFKTIRKCPWN